MLLVHAARVMNMGIDFTEIIEIAVARASDRDCSFVRVHTDEGHSYRSQIPVSIKLASRGVFGNTFISASSWNSFKRLYIVNLLDR